MEVVWEVLELVGIIAGVLVFLYVFSVGLDDPTDPNNFDTYF